jgi:hypothetical protein
LLWAADCIAVGCLITPTAPGSLFSTFRIISLAARSCCHDIFLCSCC